MIGYVKVALAPGEQARLRFRIHADLTSFTGLDLARIVEPGIIHLHVSASAERVWDTISLGLTGPRRTVGSDRRMVTEVSVDSIS